MRREDGENASGIYAYRKKNSNTWVAYGSLSSPISLASRLRIDSRDHARGMKTR